jgi:NAD(P)-dependent dehydrogenase (short-subunit alcohol dehydrogenase family)
VTGAVADLADPAECDRFIAATVSEGPIDILINNAGAFVNRGWDDAAPEDWLELYAVNVAAAVRCIRGFLPGMRAGGWGRIIQMATGQSHLTVQGSSPGRRFPVPGGRTSLRSIPSGCQDRSRPSVGA